MVTTVQAIDISLLRYIPDLLAWAIGIAAAIIMVRQGGLKDEKLLLAGCILMLLAPLGGLLLQGWLVPLFRERDMNFIELTRNWAWITLNIAVSLCSLAGLVCVVWAFLVKFWTKKQGVVK